MFGRLRSSGAAFLAGRLGDPGSSCLRFLGPWLGDLSCHRRAGRLAVRSELSLVDGRGDCGGGGGGGCSLRGGGGGGRRALRAISS